MLILYDATIDCSDEQAQVYEWAYGDYQTDSDGSYVRDDKGLLVPVNPIKFPLEHTTITNFGGRTIISIPRRGTGDADFRIDELVKSPQPKTVSKGRKSIYQLNGISTRMVRQQIDVDGASVQFTITKWRAQHLPNQKLAVLEGDE